MSVVERPFPDRFAILSTKTYVFDYRPAECGIDNRIVGRKTLRNGVDVFVTNMGMITFDYSQSEFGGFRQLILVNRIPKLKFQLKLLTLQLAISAKNNKS
jgi:hypothetical protein